jgi:hypothetical protein
MAKNTMQIKSTTLCGEKIHLCFIGEFDLQAAREYILERYFKYTNSARFDRILKRQNKGMDIARFEIKYKY